MSKSVEDILKETDMIGDMFEKKLGTERFNEILDKMANKCDWCDHDLELHTHDMNSPIYNGDHLGCQAEFCNCAYSIKGSDKK